MKKILIKIITLVCAILPICLLADSSITNMYSAPIGIKVPYYRGINPIPRNIIIVLQPGDFYKGKIGKNGYIYEQYGLMPGIAEKLIQNNSTNVIVSYSLDRTKEDESYKKFVAGLTSSSMPDWWVTECQERYFKEIREAERALEDNSKKIRSTISLYDDKKLYKKYYNQALHSYSFLTNIQNRINELSATNSDPDKDGLDNVTEYYCGSNPWKESGIVSYPKYLQLIPDGSPMVTGCFYIANRSPSNLFCKFDNALIRIQDGRYRPFLFDEYGKSIDGGMDVPGQSTNKVFCLIKDEYFPRCFYGGYDISISVTNNLIGEIILYTPGNYSHPLKQPINLLPQAGYRVEPGERILCNWEDEWDKKWDNKSRDYLNYQIPNDYQLQVIGLQKKFPLTLHIEEKKPILLIEKDDWLNFVIEPGIYLWRVNKQTCFSNPISSEWSWFSIGREVAPEKGKALGNDNAWKNYYGQVIFVYAFAKKPYDLPMGSYQARESSRFLEPLMKNQILYRTNESFRIKGVFSKPGVYTNTWLDISSDGKTNDIRQYFIVRNPAEKKNVRSYYYLKDKTIVHELFVNVPFQYKERQFFENFSKTEDLVWDKNLTMQFDTSLPKGLNLKKTEDGEDLEIMGVPLKAGDFKTCLVFSNGKSEVKEKHIFKIKDIGEPCLEPEKKFKTMYKKFSSSCVTRNRGVFHSSYVGLPMTYCFYRELKERPHDYIYYISNCTVKVIGKLPEGIVVTNLPLTAEEEYSNFMPEENSPFRKMFDKFYRDRDKVWYGFTGTPIEAGTFTNLLVFTEPGNVFTNRHIFIIKKDLD